MTSELQTDSRPDDMAELARLTAIELRKRGIWAEARYAYAGSAWFVWVAQLTHLGPRVLGEMGFHSLTMGDFDNLGPRACADLIQAREAVRAAEWAGDT
jgi:hypothetical protein